MKQKRRKQLLIFFVSLILIVQLFNVVCFAAVPSFYPLYWDAVFNATNFYSFNYYPEYLPQEPRPINKIETEHYYDESEGSFVYTGPFSPYDVGFSTKSIIQSAFNGDWSGINAVDGQPVTNAVMYEVPINLYTDVAYNLNITFTWYGSNATYIKLNEMIDNQNYAPLMPFASYNGQTFSWEPSYAYSAVVRIYSYDSQGNVILIPSTNVRFGDLYSYDGPCNPFYYNGEANSRSMAARDIEIFDYNVTDIEYLQVYILSNNYGVGVDQGYLLFDGAISNGNYVSRFVVGDSNCCYFQRFGVKAANFVEVIVPPTNEELILSGVEQIGNKLDSLENSLTVPTQIQIGIVNAQRSEFDNVSSDLDNIGGSISSEGFQVGFDDTNHDDQFMNLYDKNHADKTIARFYDASVVKRLFFLMITFALMSYVLFGKAA